MVFNNIANFRSGHQNKLVLGLVENNFRGKVLTPSSRRCPVVIRAANQFMVAIEPSEELNSSEESERFVGFAEVEVDGFFTFHAQIMSFAVGHWRSKPKNIFGPFFAPKVQFKQTSG